MDEVTLVVNVCDYRRKLMALAITEPVVARVEWGKTSLRLHPLREPPSWVEPRPRCDRLRLVEIEPVPWPIYGVRWFFRCGECQRRRDRLYAEEFGDPFRCRLCGNLTYQSAQQWDNWRRRGCPVGTDNIADMVAFLASMRVPRQRP